MRKGLLLVCLYDRWSLRAASDEDHFKRVISMALYGRHALPSNLDPVLLSAIEQVFFLAVDAQRGSDLVRRWSPSTVEMTLGDDYQLGVRQLRDDHIHMYVHEQQERRESNGESTRRCILLDRMTRVRWRSRGDLSGDHSFVGAFVVLAHVQIIFRSQWSAEFFFELLLDLAKRERGCRVRRSSSAERWWGRTRQATLHRPVDGLGEIRGLELFPVAAQRALGKVFIVVVE